MPDRVRFTETMSGSLGGRAAYFTLVVVTPDVDGMIDDADHRSPAFGCVVAPALHPLPIGVARGHLDLFVDTSPGGRTLEMRYGLSLSTADGDRLYLRGIKRVWRRRPWPTVLADTTTLFVDVFAGDRAEGEPVASGVLRQGPLSVLAQAASFRGEGAWLGLRGITRYLAYYVARITRVYLLSGPASR